MAFDLWQVKYPEVKTNEKRYLNSGGKHHVLGRYWGEGRIMFSAISHFSGGVFSKLFHIIVGKFGGKMLVQLGVFGLFGTIEF